MNKREYIMEQLDTLPESVMDKIAEFIEYQQFTLQNRNLDRRLIEALRKSNPRVVELGADENGNIIIDQNKNPDIYDWMVNG